MCARTQCLRRPPGINTSYVNWLTQIILACLKFIHMWNDPGVINVCSRELDHSDDFSVKKIMNTSCDTCEWGMPHLRMCQVTLMNEACHIWEWDLCTHMNESAHLRIGHAWHKSSTCYACEWVMPHLRIGHAWHKSSTCHTHMWMSHAAQKNKAWVMSEIRIKPYVWMSQATHINESCHTYDWVVWYVWVRRGMSHIWSECTNTILSASPHHMNESCLANTNESGFTYEWVMSHAWTSHVTGNNFKATVLKPLWAPVAPHEWVMSHTHK